MRAGVRRAAQACYGCHVFPDRLPVLYAPGSAQGELAQLARASALQAEGQGFEPPILHITYYPVSCILQALEYWIFDRKKRGKEEVKGAVSHAEALGGGSRDMARQS